jgi:protocatechuate 3,4-dioxygenase beta subunit
VGAHELHLGHDADVDLAPEPPGDLHRGTQPEYLYPPYSSTVKRSPSLPLVLLPTSLSEVTGPTFDTAWFGPEVADMTRFDKGEAQGQRMILAGRVLDEDGKPVPKTLLEIWQCNAAGRYRHQRDQQ